MIKAIENLQKGESLVQSVIVAGSIISEYPEIEY